MLETVLQMAVKLFLDILDFIATLGACRYSVKEPDFGRVAPKSVDEKKPLLGQGLTRR